MTIRAVVTNDDGIDSPGLRLLAAAALRAGCDVVVAAPDREASGTSAAMSAVGDAGRIVIEQRSLAGLGGVPCYAVRALPALIAFTAVRGAFGGRPELLVSGINRGPNTGRAILHSGTVGAAMTAATCGVPAAAFSLDARGGAGGLQWETAAGVAAEVIGVLGSLPPGAALNVNVPNVASDQLNGIRLARLAEFGAVQLSIVSVGEDYLQFTMADTDSDPDPRTDSALLAAGFATATPLRPVCDAEVAALPWPPADDLAIARGGRAAARTRRSGRTRPGAPRRPGPGPGG